MAKSDGWLHEYFESDGICLVEWADRAEEVLPGEHLPQLAQPLLLPGIVDRQPLQFIDRTLRQVRLLVKLRRWLLFRQQEIGRAAAGQLHRRHDIGRLDRRQKPF